ncbi:MAG TPA: NADH-quinone oxidoreductase subunit H [Gemmatimonadaceae bacterium]|nr:NADH-quinone oxidoreductase subunit H [Gemmatimonadaceae bacterium]
MIGAELVQRAAALAIVMVFAPLIPGVASRTRSFLTARRGPPVWQLYADLGKLVRRGVVYSRTTTGMFRFAPIGLLASVILAASMLPLDGAAALLRFPGDVFAFVYVLALGRFVLVLGALDTGSSFEGMGASREVTFAALVEFGLFIALAALSVASRELSLSGMLGSAEIGATWTTSAPAILLVIAGLFVLLLAECSRAPVDDPTTHLELTMIHEVIVLDHSGPDLAMILYASALKLSIFGALLVGVAVPTTGQPYAMRLGVLLAGLFTIGVFIGVVEAMMARLRLPKVPLYIAGGSALSAFALILLLR